MKSSLFASFLALLVSVGMAATVSAGPLLGDSDGDGKDDLFDNCRDTSNSDQTDTDGDGCGNACDADYDNNAIAGGSDFSIFRATFGKTPGEPSYNANADHNGDGIIGGPDFAIFRSLFGTVPGPSKLPTRTVAVCP